VSILRIVVGTSHSLRPAALFSLQTIENSAESVSRARAEESIAPLKKTLYEVYSQAEGSF
jgi:hypothetical protein